MAKEQNKPTPRFMDLIQTPGDQVEAPPLHPVGHFRGFVDKIEFGEFDGNTGKVDTVEFHLKAEEPLGDVDRDEWDSYRSNEAAKRSTRLRTRVFVEKDNLHKFYGFMVKKFGASSSMTGQAMLEHSQGARCAFEVKHGTSKDGTPFADINRVLNQGEALPE